MAYRYLGAYGPATPDDFARWWGVTAGQARRLFRLLGDEIEPVDVEGWHAWALASALESRQARKELRSVCLLPKFDAYVEGWISAVVLVDGHMAGIWEYDRQPSQTVVRLEMFDRPTAQVKRGIEHENSI